jgi:hypothetical protein
MIIPVFSAAAPVARTRSREIFSYHFGKEGRGSLGTIRDGP